MLVSEILNKQLETLDEEDKNAFINFVRRNDVNLLGINIINGSASIVNYPIRVVYNDEEIKTFENVKRFECSIDTNQYKSVVLGSVYTVAGTISIIEVLGDLITPEYKWGDIEFKKKFWFSNFMIEWMKK